MESRRDPVESAAESGRDLYDVATWEERSSLDGLAVALYWLVTRTAKAIVLLLALAILLGIGGLTVLSDPALGTLTLLSALPALGLAAYVYYSDVTTSEPLSLLVATFLLAVLTATFAAMINSVAQPAFQGLGALGMVLFFYLVVGPVEETVKLLAVRLYAYNDTRFNAVIDGAVYGAIAGLGFATIENALYISQQVDAAELEFGLGIIGAGGGITAVRALAGPGHVIYSAFAGYYLGLAKFNPENRGPIVVKGLLIAAVIHATYNSTVGLGSLAVRMITGLPDLWSFFVYVLLFDAVFAFVLLRKIWRYRRVYRDTRAEIDESASPELTEFEQ